LRQPTTVSLTVTPWPLPPGAPAPAADPAADPADPGGAAGPADLAVAVSDPAGDTLEVRLVPPGSRRRAVAKRLFDVVFAALALVLLLPLFAVLAAGVTLTSPGPVLYGHRRVGRGGRTFRCWKFRTMVHDADRVLADLLASRPDLREEFARTHKLRDDPRVTPFGRWLRRTSLDELPQFWNVLRGDMSVVGPRPLVELETVRYGRAIGPVLQLRPGITGVWQTSGRNDVPYVLRVQMDATYVGTYSLRGDLRIVLRTVGVVLRTRRNGAY